MDLHVAGMEERGNVYKIVVGKSKGKMPLGSHGHRWKDNIRIDLGEIGWEDVDCIYLAQDGDQWWTLVNTVMNLGFHKRRGIS
jgi:hypothetical protein